MADRLLTHQADTAPPDERPLLIEMTEDGRIATLTLNRPAARNSLDRRLVSALTDALTALSERPGLQVLVLTGTGERAFCAGADLIERLAMTVSERTAHTAAIAAVAGLLAAVPVPTIAAIRGFAVAGGAELALACDLRVATHDAVFGFPEVGIGIFPGAGGVVRLPRLIGPGRARDLLFTGRRIRAEEAYQLGLINRLVDNDALSATSGHVASQIAANAPLAIRALKQALVESAGQADASALQIVALHRQPLDATLDYAEGLAAFAERRAPRFRGE